MNDDRVEILISLREYLSRAFSTPGHDVQWHSRLEDLGLDSLDIVEVTAALMDTAGGGGAWEDPAPVMTVSDLVTLVAKTRT